MSVASLFVRDAEHGALRLYSVRKSGRCATMDSSQLPPTLLDVDCEQELDPWVEGEML